MNREENISYEDTNDRNIKENQEGLILKVTYMHGGNNEDKC